MFILHQVLLNTLYGLFYLILGHPYKVVSINYYSCVTREVK